MKNAIKVLLIFSAWSMLLGCAEVTSKTYGARKTVTVKYSTGWFMAEKNRSKAVETARQYCQPGQAVLVREDNKAEFTGKTYTSQRTDGNYTSGEATQAKEDNVYLHFVCNRQRG
jgi:hypothetical protein